jgi:hypothetical protein
MLSLFSVAIDRCSKPRASNTAWYEKILSSGAPHFALSVEVTGKLQVAAGRDPKEIETYILSLGWKPFCSRRYTLEPGSSCPGVTFIHESRIAEVQMTLT